MHDLILPPTEVEFPIGFEILAVDQIFPREKNARTHSKDQVCKIADSIREFGWTNPLVVDDEGSVVAGHGRLRAAQLLGLDRVPVIRVGHMSDDQKRAYLIADNQLALRAGWDQKLLAAELNDLRNLGLVDLGLIGFSAGELERLLAPYEGQGGLTDDDEVPDRPLAPVARPGDLWRLGDHRVYCGDALKASSYELLLGSERASLIFTDPPYNVAYEGKTKARMTIRNDDLGDDFEPFLREMCTRILEAADGAVYICMSSSEIHRLRCAWEGAGGKWSTFIIWAKNNFTLGRSDYQRQYEPILYGWKKGGEHYWAGGRNESDVWHLDRPVANRLHPTAKPVELVERAIRNSSRKGDIVLDPFGGGGSTLIACEKLGRKARLMEIDPDYVDVVLARWRDYTGLEPIDVEGNPFARRQ